MNCLICGKELNPQRSTRKYCSARCNTIAFKRRWMMRDPDLLMTINEDMGATFQMVGAGCLWGAGDQFACYKLNKEEKGEE